LPAVVVVFMSYGAIWLSKPPQHGKHVYVDDASEYEYAGLYAMPAYVVSGVHTGFEPAVGFGR